MMTERELQNLLKKYRVPFHIVLHMKKVAAVGVFIAQKIKAHGEEIDVKSVRQGALLHDIMKLSDFKDIKMEYFRETPTQDDLDFWRKLIDTYHVYGHEVAGYKILKALGEEKLALIVKKHRFASLTDHDPEEQPQTWEEKLVYYADKRVAGDKIVSIEERIADGQRRYFPNGNIPPEDEVIKKHLRELEQKICQKAKIKPEDVREENVAGLV